MTAATILAPETLDSMNAARKADREHIVRELVTIADRHGALIERRETDATAGYSGKGVHLNFSLNGVGAMMSIDNLHGGFYCLISWYNDYRDGRRGARDFTSRFNGNVGASSSMRPHHKATSSGNGWYALALMLDAGLCLAARGEAFEPSVS